MKVSVRLTASLAAMLLAAAPATAMEWLSSDDLEKSCDSFLANSDSDNGALCLAYMQGFIAGSGTADTLADMKSEGTGGKESYAERATRTRLGTLRLQQIRGIGDDHCLDEDETAVNVVEKIANYLEDHPDTLELTNAEAVHQALLHHYPCSE